MFTVILLLKDVYCNWQNGIYVHMKILPDQGNVSDYVHHFTPPQTVHVYVERKIVEMAAKERHCYEKHWQ